MWSGRGRWKFFIAEIPASLYAMSKWQQRMARISGRIQAIAIAAYATEMAGTPLDLDAELESAAIEHLVKTGKATR